MVDCVEFVNFDATSGHETPIDATAKNPNGVEFDNLYLDMNGIIHPCTHPEDRPAPTTEEEMFDAICDYIDRIFSIVRPRKLLYMAIDGVAPRAKINQQRSRRFRSAKEAEEKLRVAEELKDEWDKMGLKVGQREEDDAGSDDSHLPFDSNVITPGTPFMSRLAIALRVYVADRIKNNLAWRDVVVVFSDASVPGEGEHKIAEYIRRERTQSDYNPSLRHVMYGLDADLIMLALATHEVYFTILREEVFAKRGGGGNPHHQRSGQNSKPLEQKVDPAVAAMAQESGLSTRSDLGGKKPFHFLHVHILREYLDYEFKADIEKELAGAKPSTDITYDLERVLDDFVFMCFFVGNDFLPHLPTLDIREGAIDYLIELYKTELCRTGYLTSSQGDVDFGRVRKLLQCVGRKEDEIFKERAVREQQSMERAAQQKKEKEELKNNTQSAGKVKSPGAKRTAAEKDKGYQDAAFSMATIELGRKDKKPRIGSGEANAAAAAALKANLNRLSGDRSKSEGYEESEEATIHEQTKLSKRSGFSEKPAYRGPTLLKSKAEFKDALNERMREKNELEVFDNIKLGEEGWKERYYMQKFEWGPEHKEEKMQLLRKYVEGLQWVMKYYYVGCLSWGWYYPYHYAPFASDLVECDISSEDIVFELGTPFAPFTQLQAVMPASSGKLVLPTCYSDLMIKPESPIIDYYPENFALDLNGKRFAWQGVALLPFIDESRLNAALEPLQNLLTEEERERNSFGDCCVMVHKTSPLGVTRSKRASKDASERKKIPKETAQGQLFGRTSYPLVIYGGLNSDVYTMVFALPSYKPHQSSILPTATVPQAHLTPLARGDSRRSGWKQAKFGSLGRAARELVNDRNRRLGGIGSGRQRPRNGARHQTGFLPDAPVINGPAAMGPNAAVSGMFGGLGGQAQPSWMRSSRGRGHVGGQQQYVPQQRGAYGQQQMQQRQQSMYGNQGNRYGEQGGYGGYYPQQAQAGWNASQPGSAQAGWQSRHGPQAGWGNASNEGGYAGGGYSRRGGGGGGYYGGEQSSSRGRQGRRGGGLAGPTAGSLRSHQGQGQGHGHRQDGPYNGGWGGPGY